MNPETRAAINQALEERYRAYIKALSKSATLTHRNAQVEADKIAGLKITPEDWSVINDAAIRFGIKYQQMLEEKGASIINGEEIDWLDALKEAERDYVSEFIQKGIDEGKAISEISTGLEEHFNFSKSHAETVAITETGRIRNIGNMERWGERGFDKVGIIDDEGPNSCEECALANGQIWPMDYALSHELQHPRCVRRPYPAGEEEPLTDPSEYPEEPG